MGVRGGGNSERIWIGNYYYFLDHAVFMAVPDTDKPVEYFIIEASPAGAVKFIEGEAAEKENDWSPSMYIDWESMIEFSAKYTNPDDDQKVTITIKAMNSDGNVVVSDTWSGKLKEKGENFHNITLSEILTKY